MPEVFKLPPIDETTAAQLRQAMNSAAMRPADPRYVTFHFVSKYDKLATEGGMVTRPDPETGQPKEVWLKPAGFPVYKRLEYVTILCPGDKDTVVDRPVHNVDRYAWKEKYEAFRNDQSQDINGIPLAEWKGGLPPERVASLAHMHIKTVEQLADVPDSNLANLGSHARADREKARGYLAVMKGEAPVAKLQQENDELRKRLEALEALALKSTVKPEEKAKTK